MVLGTGSKWNLKMLMDVLQANKARENSSVSAVQQALRRLASNRAKISKERILDFVSADQVPRRSLRDFKRF